MKMLYQREIMWAIRNLLRRRGFELRRVPTLIDFLEARDIDLVYDVGANEGQFAVELRLAGYRGRIMSFEPVTQVYETLTQAAKQDAAWDVRRLALGSRTAEIAMNVSENTVFSSILPQTAMAASFDHQARVQRTEVVPMAKLDDIFEEDRGSRVFLKVDTQGFEREVLEGARESLRKFLGIQLELLIEHLYQGTWSLAEALGFMADAGFVLSQVRSTNVLKSDRTSSVELDCVFRRRTA